MKKSKLSFVVALAILGASLTAFTTKSSAITAGWYGQPNDGVPPYNTSNFISAPDLNVKCPVGTAHLCAAYLKSDGTLDGSQNPNTRMSANNYR